MAKPRPDGLLHDDPPVTVQLSGLPVLSEHQVQVTCPVCGSLAAHYFSLPQTTVWECSATQCKLQFADPQLDDSSLTQVYESLYYPTENSEDSSYLENTSDGILRQVFPQLEDRVGKLRGQRLLDYGCGVGSLLRVSTEFGMQPTGIETNAQARLTASAAAGAPVYRNLEELCAAEPTAFDVIIMWTVVEHLRRPWEDLARLRRLLVSGGWLLISTINIRCLRARLQRHHWVQYRNPTHFYYFDRRSLAQVIGKAGFSELCEWRIRFRYPHHGTLRRWLYSVDVAAGLADGLFFLCRNSVPRSEEITSRNLKEIAMHSAKLGTIMTESRLR